MKILSKLFRGSDDKRNVSSSKLYNNSYVKKIKTKSYSGSLHLPRDDFLFGDNVSTSTRRRRRKHRVFINK